MNNRKNKRQQYNNQLLQNIQSSETFCKLSSEKIAELHQSKLKMLNFINTIENNVEIPSNNPVSIYCENLENFKITAEEIIKMMNQRIQKMMKNQKVKKNWGKQDINILIWTLINFMNFNKITSINQLVLINYTQKKQNWQAVSELIPGTTGNSCMFKLLNLKKIRISERKWTLQQQQNLNKLVNFYKNQNKINWRIVSQQLFLMNFERDKIFRTAKQCKQHWASFLNQQMKKGPWSYNEDIQMLQFILKNKGRTKWATMAKKICSRTQNALKNRYNLILKQQKKYYPQQSEMNIIKLHLQKLYKKYCYKSYSFENKVEEVSHKKLQTDQIYQQSQQKEQQNQQKQQNQIQKTQLKKENEENKDNKNIANSSLFMPLQTGTMCPMIYPTFIMFGSNMFSKQKSD